MAFRSLCFLCLFFILQLHPLGISSALRLPLDAIYHFGDPLSDTGNFIRENSTSFCSSLPYGETFFHMSTGRCSDGLLMVDFIAKALKLQLLNPYLEKDANFSHGVNFAVSGAAALDTLVLAAKNITVLNTNSSLSVQLGWLRTHLKSTSSSATDCKHRLRKTLFMLGPLGANNYIYALQGGKSIQDLYKLVPDVVHFIKEAANKLIDHGSAQVIVPGYFPFGCSPFFVVMSTSNDTSMYDEFKCSTVINGFIEYHYGKLKDVVNELQHDHLSVYVSYGDIYSAFAWLFQNAAPLGFEEDGLLTACCGDGNNGYNYNASRLCGTRGVSACRDPNKRVSWDGLHLTQQAIEDIAGWLPSDSIVGL